MDQSYFDENTGIWTLSHGEWSKRPAPESWRGTDTFEEAMEQAGFGRTSSWGELASVDLFEGGRDKFGQFVIDWCPAGSGCHYLLIETVPDLLEILPKLASVTVAHILNFFSEELSELAMTSGADAKKEFDRRLGVAPGRVTL